MRRKTKSKNKLPRKHKTRTRSYKKKRYVKSKSKSKVKTKSYKKKRYVKTKKRTRKKMRGGMSGLVAGLIGTGVVATGIVAGIAYKKYSDNKKEKERLGDRDDKLDDLCKQYPNDPACKKERVNNARKRFYSAKDKNSQVAALDEMID